MFDEINTELIVSKIVEVINDKHINISKMENELGIGKTIAFWKRGTQPTVEKLIKVLKYLNISLDEIIGINIKRESKIITVPSYTVDTRKDLKWIYKCLTTAEAEENINEMREDITGTKEYIEKALEKYNEIE